MPHWPTGVSFGRGRLWVTGDDGTVTTVDPHGNRVLAVSAVGRWPLQVAFAGDAAWVANSDDDTLSRVAVASGHEGWRVAGGFPWVGNNADSTVSQVDEETNTVIATIAVGARPSDITAGAGAVWVQFSGGHTIYRLEPFRHRTPAPAA